jgi:hypothetical protein
MPMPIETMQCLMWTMRLGKASHHSKEYQPVLPKVCLGLATQPQQRMPSHQCPKLRWEGTKPMHSMAHTQRGVG